MKLNDNIKMTKIRINFSFIIITPIIEYVIGLYIILCKVAYNSFNETNGLYTPNHILELWVKEK